MLFRSGMMFGWLYYRTGSLLPGIVGHVLNNSMAAISMILYGNSTIEEQVQDTMVMWTWALISSVILVVAAIWLNRNLKKD